jgi:hypothetical protein
VELIEAPLFTQFLSGYLEDDQYRRLQLSLALDPEAGDGCTSARSVDREENADVRTN